MSENSPVELIVGLGNPGAKYAHTRHNVGVWLVELLARQYAGDWVQDKKLGGRVAKVNIDGHICRLFVPATYMNESGLPVRKVAQFFKLAPGSVLIVHDELDFEPGKVRLKADGGHGGHNGLRDVLRHLGSSAFKRLRVGIGHPGAAAKVKDYVLSKPSIKDKKLIDDSMLDAVAIIPDVVSGELDVATRWLHRSE